MRAARQLHAGHYRVPSESDPDIMYDVDILAYEGQGHCTCQDWMMRIGPRIERGEIPERRFCKHLIECRDDFTDLVIERYLDAIRKGG